MTEKIYKAICNVMSDVGAIGKDKTADVGKRKYQYRGIDDVMNALQPAMVKNGIFVVPCVLNQIREERKDKYGGTLIYSISEVEYTFYADDGSNVKAVVVGEAMDSGDKSMNKAMSAAFKYACFQTFCIQTEDLLDSEQDDPRPVPTELSPRKNIDAQVQKMETTPITAAHVDILSDMILDTGTDAAEFLKYYGVSHMTELTEAQYGKALNLLTQKKRKAQSAGKVIGAE